MAKKQIKPTKKTVDKSPQVPTEDKPPKLSTEKMKGETNRHFLAWLLYCQAGSLRKTLAVWDKALGIEGEVDYRKLGKKPSLKTLNRWSMKYRWGERDELRFEETLAGLKKETIRIDKERKDRVAQLFKIAMNKKLRQLNIPQGEAVSDTLLNYLWRMHRVEMGLPTDYSKHDVYTPIREEDQQPLTPEETVLSQKITQLEKEHNDKINQ